MTLFIALMSLVTTSIAGAAGFFSIYGLAQMFSGTFWAVVVMGVSLEAGKLMTASFLYRYWTKIGVLLKTYMCIAVLILMAITSAGIFGFLSKAYQTDSLPMKEMEIRIASLEKEQQRLNARKTDIDTQLSKVDPTVGKARLRLNKEFDVERKQILERLPVVEAELSQYREKILTTQLHIGPITYIAQAFGKSVDDGVKYMIMLIIIAFDPLAIAMTLGVNIAIREHQRSKDEAASKAKETTQSRVAHPLDEDRANLITQMGMKAMEQHFAQHVEEMKIPLPMPVSVIYDPVPLADVPPPSTDNVADQISELQEATPETQNVEIEYDPTPEPIVVVETTPEVAVTTIPKIVEIDGHEIKAVTLNRPIIIPSLDLQPLPIEATPPTEIIRGADYREFSINARRG